MIRSMTGFGEATGETAAGTLRVELRTVNHRYLNVNSRLPNSLVRWEGELREWLRESFARGHVNCTARWERAGIDADGPSYRLDEAKVASYLELFVQLQSRYDVKGTVDLSLLSRFNDIFVRSEEPDDPPEVTGDDLRPIVMAAARQVVRMREDEGARLEADLRQRLVAIEEALRDVELRAPARLIAERERLRSAVAELLGDGKLDESRVAQEIALLAERWDLNEEIVRFRSHNELFAELLDAKPEEPVGKRLSFLVQEMNREANTIGSKANDASVAHLVVRIKDELERLREQVENVE
jgi:uncharacterized protein (TIGR00255 family)